MYRLRRSYVSGNFFDVLGARAVLGRALRPSDDVDGAAPVVVLSYAAWQRMFGGDSAVLGRKIVKHENGVAYDIVGVMPQGLDYSRKTDFWASIMPAGKTLSATDSIHAEIDLIARLAPGATPEAARDELTAYLRRPGASPWSRTLRGVVNTLPRLIVGDTRPALFVFAAAAALLLLITCINVANLLLVRGLARIREIAVRSALGASRARVVLQLLVENSLLALAGGAAGIAVAASAVKTFVAFAPPGVPRLDEIHVNATALAGAFAITAAAMLLFSLAPAVMTSRVDLQQVLRSDTRQTGSRRSRALAETLVVGQLALALVVLSAAGLIAKSLINLERAKLSLEPSGLLVGDLSLRYDQYDDVKKQLALLDRLMIQLKTLPGVRAVSPVVSGPFTMGWSSRPASEKQSPEEAARNPVVNMELVAPDYFKTLGIPVLRGRTFTEGDREGAPPVIMVSESTARYYWPGQDPIGHQLLMGGKLDRALTVIGVVPDTRYRDLREARPSMYYPLHQSFFPFAPTTLAIRTSGNPAAMVPVIRRSIEDAAPGVTLPSAEPFETYLQTPLAQPRLNALLLAVFAASAAALAAIGLFGVMATMVRQRTRELGVRMALGATAADLRRVVLRRGLTIAAVGIGAGVLGAVATNRLLVAMLYDVSPTDFATLALVSILLLGVTMLSIVLPARSSTRIDPVIALRSEG